METVSQNLGPSVALFDQTLEEAFPVVKTGHRPFGTKIIVQIRGAKDMTRGGIALHDETRNTIIANTQVCKVIAIGPMAFHSPTTGKPWPEGPWFKEGDYVRCPKFGGDRFEVPVPGKNGEVAYFGIWDHLQFSAMVEDPLEVITFI